MGLRLGFHYHMLAARRETGQVVVSSYIGVFIDSIAAECEHLILFFHSAPSHGKGTERVQTLNYTLTQPNITWVDIGAHSSTLRRTFHPGPYTAHLTAWREKLDALLIRGPSPLLPAMAAAAGDLPVVLLMVGDYLAEARAAGFSLAPRKLLQRAWVESYQVRQARTIRRHMTVVNSRQLYHDFERIAPKIHETRTTTLTMDDGYEREDTCAAPPYRVLYTGRITASKGIADLLDAVLMLRAAGIDLVLDLVGWPEDESFLPALAQTAAERGEAAALVYHGLKKVGAELFAYYKQADLYVIASRSSFEGFPRTVWEAMAHSLPVAATPVGSIPMYLQDGETVILFTPNDPAALAAALKRLIDDSGLRRRLIANGRAVVKENTLENRARELVGCIQEWVTTHGR
ncbi:MAG: glycosyltransferase family 4 protein [bacterium]|nr:glycosyltransferase family 4 protein [bacterium]